MAVNPNTKITPFYIDQLQNPDINPFGTISFYIRDNSRHAIKYDQEGFGGSKLTFAMTNDFSLGLSASWDKALNLQDTLDNAQNMAATVAGTLGGSSSTAIKEILGWIPGASKIADGINSFGNSIANKRIKPLALSYLTWLKSEMSSLSFNLYRFALRPDDDTTMYFKNLARMVMPSYYANAIVSTPGGYVPPFEKGSGQIADLIKDLFKGAWNKIFDDKVQLSDWDANDSIDGTVTVQIGRWCTIRGLLVSSLSMTMSQVCTSAGLPLYTKGKIDLIPYRMVIFEDIENMLSGGQVVSGNRTNQELEYATFKSLFGD